ncbi:uncharacterized protein B0J16DRAFT_412505 [Fusarium flagelliforme]|uniref:uncharacterized protein n=1 Tax=Fusarium flagelliforme TaxID=2675880 RepID=UPI001E8DA575|nr:uncharacterized protein B0J16DRAFT_412505 [Fusarium flagelliforme]KAH7193976.1 hypothetical protein B0J16DRAFT_412505 [Fusarium flagelliforme]
MKFSQAAFQLLALYHLAAASPCKPFSSGTSTVTTTTEIGPSTTFSAESGTFTTTLSESESTSDSTTLVSTSGAEPTTTLEATTSTLPDEPTTTFVSTTVEPPTTTAEASTTTSLPQGPPNLAVNGGFEDGTTSPWVNVSPQGTLEIITSSVHSGSQAGHFTGKAPSSIPSKLGIKQDISTSTLEAGKTYKLSAWYILSPSNGFGLNLMCGYGWQTLPSSTRLAQVAGYSQAEIMCSWSQEQLNAGPNIQIQGYLFNADFIIDDVVLEEIE